MSSSLKSHESFQDLTSNTLEEEIKQKSIEHVGEPGSGPPYFDWRELYPELQILKDNFQDIVAEAKTINYWIPWPEDHFAKNGVTNWTVFPFLHTFPAYDESKKRWVESTCAHCPKIVSLLQQIPNIRTALFSRLGSGVQISPHTGWADLANYVLRCHLSVIIPVNHISGLWVNGVEQFHVEGEIIVFDDSKIHKAFNLPIEKSHLDPVASLTSSTTSTTTNISQSETSTTNDQQNSDRIILIIDILRPQHVPLGGATGKHTQELDSLISAFR